MKRVLNLHIIISVVNSDEDKNVTGMRRGGTACVEYKIVSITRRCNIPCVAAFVLIWNRQMITWYIVYYIYS